MKVWQFVWGQYEPVGHVDCNLQQKRIVWLEYSNLRFSHALSSSGAEKQLGLCATPWRGPSNMQRNLIDLSDDDPDPLDARTRSAPAQPLSRAPVTGELGPMHMDTRISGSCHMESHVC